LPWWLSMGGLLALLGWLRPAGGYRCR
jgi:hypothetical protein